MRNAIDKSLTERDSNIDKFCNHLDKDIAELGKEVKEVKQEAQVIFVTIVKKSLYTILIANARYFSNKRESGLQRRILCLLGHVNKALS